MIVEHLDIEGNRRIPFITTPAAGHAKGVALLVHGIFSEKNEDGRFARLARELSKLGLASIRFDYSGHGDHSYPSSQFSICNALADLHWIVDMVRAHYPAIHFHIIASSFGGSLVLLYSQLSMAVMPERLVLLNPVTDYGATFLHPRCPQMQERFSLERQMRVHKEGSADFGDGFVVALPLLIEMEVYRPFEAFPELTVPTLVIHGDSDTAVPYQVTRQQALRGPTVQFETIKGADHAFVEPSHESESFALVIRFLGETHAS